MMSDDRNLSSTKDLDTFQGSSRKDSPFILYCKQSLGLNICNILSIYSEKSSFVQNKKL